MQMLTMRNMVNDIRNELKERNTSVLCEVYDGQFHQIIVRSQEGYPLTRIQHCQDHFRKIMLANSREELLSILLAYSKISDENYSQIRETEFNDLEIVEMETVTISMRKSLVSDDETINKITIESNPIENFQMSDISTNHRDYIWKRYVDKYEKYRCNISRRDNVLSKEELTTLIQGMKMHRHISQQNIQDYMSEQSDNDFETSYDPDYIPVESESDESDTNTDLDIDVMTEHDISVVSTTSTGCSCIKLTLNDLKCIDNKHKWKEETIVSFLRKYLSSKRNMSKLFLYELDVINCQVQKNFNKNDTKKVKVSKLHGQLRQMPQLLQYDSSDEDPSDLFQPEKLFNIHWKFLTSHNYPKEYLAAPVYEIMHMESVLQWESQSKIQICLNLPFGNSQHIIFNYPEFSEVRDQCEMRTFDYRHIINNL